VAVATAPGVGVEVGGDVGVPAGVDWVGAVVGLGVEVGAWVGGGCGVVVGDGKGVGLDGMITVVAVGAGVGI